MHICSLLSASGLPDFELQDKRITCALFVAAAPNTRSSFRTLEAELFLCGTSRSNFVNYLVLFAAAGETSGSWHLAGLTPSLPALVYSLLIIIL